MKVLIISLFIIKPVISCRDVTNLAAEIKHFHVGGLKVDQRLLAMIVTKIIVPRRRNHSTLNEGHLILMYCIQHNVQVDWIFVLHDCKTRRKIRIKGKHIDKINGLINFVDLFNLIRLLNYEI